MSSSTFPVRVRIAVAAFVLAGAAHAMAQPVMRSFTISCGGQVVSGGTLRMTSTIGQHIASENVAGGPWRLSSGFITPSASCEADVNSDGALNSQDLFDYLAVFFEFLPSADFNDDGVINSQDFFAFLTAFFAGC